LAGALITAGIMYLPSMLGGGESAKKGDKTDSSKIAAANTKKSDTNVTTSTEVTLPDTNNSSSTGTSSDNKEGQKDNPTGDKKEPKKEEPKTTTTETGNTGNSGTSSNTTTPTYTPPVTTNAGSSIINSFPYRPQTPTDLSTATLSTPTSKYYIVLGGFGNKANAYSLYNNLKSRNYPAKIMAPTGNSSLHRVVLGGYDSEAEAESKRRSYTGSFGAKIWVTKY
jgi:cell division septation protein DedD